MRSRERSHAARSFHCRRICRLFLLSCLPVLSSGSLSCVAQAGSAPAADKAAPAYDVVSIRPNKTSNGSVNVSSNLDSYIASGVSLKMLIEQAYGIKADLIYGIAGSAESARFDVKAKISDPDLVALKSMTNRQRAAMLQPLLEERFHLKIHTKTRTLPVFEMVVLKDGPKFQPLPAVEAGERKENSEGGMSVRSSNNTREGVTINTTEMTATGIAMSSLMNTLASELHRTVIDKTGLTGRYNLTLKWSHDTDSATMPASSSGVPSGSSADTGPSLFNAVQEQLGLRLVSAKGPVETIVVDHVEMPTED